MKLTNGAAFVAVASLAVTMAVSSPAQATESPSSTVLPRGAQISPEAKAELDRLVAKLPADWQARRDVAFENLGIDRSPVREVVEARTAEAINPDDYECNPTKLDSYVDSILADIDPGTLFVLAILGVLDFPTYDAILYGKPKDANYALPQAYAANLTQTFGYAQRFWDVKLDDVRLLAMHGEMVSDVNRVAKVVGVLYGLDQAESVDFARDVVDIVTSDPALENGDNPIFTLNAFAFSGVDEPDPVFNRLPDKMVFGDGILDALKELGLKQVGPKAVLGHEMAHHVQYEANLFESDLTGPEATRRTELMADAFGSYFAAHKKGLALKANQLLLVQDSFYDVGDCSFTSNGHHGTPNQRRAASSWGIATAATGDQVKVIKAVKLGARFDKVLPQLVAPDAPSSPAAWNAAVRAAA